MNANRPPDSPTQDSVSVNFAQALAYLTALALTLASAATNVTSSVNRYPDLSAKIIAGTIAASVAVLVSIALAAALQALARRQFTVALVAGVAFLLAGSFSVTAALGTLGGVRLQSSMSTAHSEAQRERLTTERARALGELETLAPARPSTELVPQIAALLATQGIGVPACAAVDGPITRKVCPVLATLQEEVARANRRSALTGTLARIDADLAKVGAPVLANPDAETLAHVLAVLGVTVGADRLNVALMVLAVIILECGGGLSLAVGGALRGAVVRSTNSPPLASAIIPPAIVPAERLYHTPQAVVPPIAAPVEHAERRATEEIAKDSAFAGVPGDATPCNTGTRDRVLQIVRDAGGSVRLDQRTLAKTLGVAPSTVNRAIAALQADGLIAKRSGSTGSVLAAQ